MQGVLHDLFSALVFLALPAVCFVFARRFARRSERGWAIYSRVSAVAFMLAFVLTSVGFSQAEGFVNIAGLLQRVTLMIGWAWLSLLAVHTLRTSPLP